MTIRRESIAVAERARALGRGRASRRPPSRSLLKSGRFGPRVAAMKIRVPALALSLGVAVVGCAGGQKKSTRSGGGALASGGGESNVPEPPPIDRTKCDDKGKQVVTADTNQDQKPDVWKMFSSRDQGGQTVQTLSCKQVDLQHDGKVDIVQYYDEQGEMNMEEMDLDFDGKFDRKVYYQGGKKVRVEMDQDYDQSPDVWEYYENEKKARVERDTNGDGRVDEWAYYEGDRLTRIGYDTSGSGKVDKWDRAPEEEASAPPPAPAVGTPPSGATPAAPAPTPPPAAAPK